MRKPLVIGLTIAVTSMLLTGCVEDLGLTDEKSQILSDYMAQTVMKHQKDTEYKLIKTEKAESTTNPELDDTPEEVNPTGNIEQPDSTGEYSTEEGAESTSNGTNTETTIDENNSTLAETMGLKGVDVTIKSKKLIQEYKDSEFYTLQAEDGTVLLELVFQLSNTSDSKQKINFTSRENIAYQLVIGQNVYLPLMTAIENDIMSLDVSLDAGSDTQAILMYQINSSDSSGIMELKVESDSGSSVVSVK